MSAANLAGAAKRALITYTKAANLKPMIPSVPQPGFGRQLAVQCNKILAEAQAVCAADAAFADALSHLEPLEYETSAAGSEHSRGGGVQVWSAKDNSEALAQQGKLLLTDVLSTLKSFVDFYLPEAEKQHVGWK